MSPVRQKARPQAHDRRLPWWHLSLLERFSIGVQVAGFVVALALIVVGASYRAYVSSAQELVRQVESGNLSGAAHVAQARIEAESRVLMVSALALARHPVLREALQDPAAPALAQARLECNSSFDLSGFSMLHLIDRHRTIVHRVAEAGPSNSTASIWGLADVLAGDTLLQTSKEAGGGLVVRAMAPVRGSGNSVVGAVVAATRFDDSFAQRIGKDGGVELAFATPQGVVARSSQNFVNAPGLHQAHVESALFQRRAVLDFDLDRAALRQYVPLKLGDETFVLIVQGNAAEAQARVVQAAQNTMLTSVALLGFAVVASCLFALMLADRLRRVGARARTLAHDITGQDVMQDTAGAPARPAVRSELAVLEHVFDRTALAVARHHEELHDAKERAEHAANFDGLTGLVNRAFLMRQVAQDMAERPDAEWALIFLDLDGFKQVNDSHGHAAGDALLCQAANRLRELVDEQAVVARLGGDEFVVLAHHPQGGHASDHRTGLQEQAQRLARAMIVALERPFYLNNQQAVLVSASIGIALHPTHGQDPALLFKRADIALYAAKHAGRRCCRVYGQSAAVGVNEFSLVA